MMITAYCLLVFAFVLACTGLIKALLWRCVTRAHLRTTSGDQAWTRQLPLVIQCTAVRVSSQQKFGIKCDPSISHDCTNNQKGVCGTSFADEQVVFVLLHGLHLSICCTSGQYIGGCLLPHHTKTKRQPSLQHTSLPSHYHRMTSL